MSSLRRFDFVNVKTHDDLKVRTISGAAISVCCYVFASVLLISEYRTWRQLETIDVLDVDTTSRPDGRLPVNIDLYLPSLPCGELVTEVTDDSGSQQIHVTDSLHKLRMDRNGVPIDLPERVDFGHVIAPAFQQRKVVQLMEEAQQHLSETIGHFDHEEAEFPDLSVEEHQVHRAQLAEQAAQLHGRLTRLTEVVAEGEQAAEAGDHEHLELSARELSAMHEEVSSSRIYTAQQRERVLANLHAMSRSVARLRNGSSITTASNLREALRIRLSILNDNVQGFVSAADIDRRDRYSNVEELLRDVANASALLPAEQAGHLEESLVLVGDRWEAPRPWPHSLRDPSHPPFTPTPQTLKASLPSPRPAAFRMLPWAPPRSARLNIEGPWLAHLRAPPLSCPLGGRRLSNFSQTSLKLLSNLSGSLPDCSASEC